MHIKTRKYLEIKLVAYFLTFKNTNAKDASKIMVTNDILEEHLAVSRTELPYKR